MRKIQLYFFVFLTFMLLGSACTEDIVKDYANRQITVYATMPGTGMNDGTGSTANGPRRVALRQTEGTLDLIARWTANDVIHLFVIQEGKCYAMEDSNVSDISDDGKSCSFTIQLPSTVDPGCPYEVIGLCDAEGMVVDNTVAIAKCPLKRVFWSDGMETTAPIWFRCAGNDAGIRATFKHLGTYEVLHVKNTTASSIDFMLWGFDTPNPWYKYDINYTLDDNFDPLSYVIEPGDVESNIGNIAAGATGKFLSWYIPTGLEMKDAILEANINGKPVSSVNAKSSSVNIQQGHAYHMYATWDGNELKFDNGELNDQKLIRVEPTKISFGNVPVGTSKTEHFTVSNDGSLDLTFKVSETHLEQYDIPESGKEFTLAAGKSKVFDVVFTPLGVGVSYGRIVRIFSDAENGTQTVALSGTGADAATAEKQTFTVNGVSFDMIAVEGGTFWMGAEDDDYEASSVERPRHEVRVDDYAIGQTEVTQQLWETVMGNNPSNWKGVDLPVENVSWDECQTFISKLNTLTGREFRLPTEAEWEFAARGGKNSNGYKYSGSNDIDAVAWYTNNSNGQTHPVAQKAYNELGIYDMSGNVWEWCNDWYDEQYYSVASHDNPTGPSATSFHVRRGGRWDHNSPLCRVSSRNDGLREGESQYDGSGLRLALSDGGGAPIGYLTCPDSNHPHLIDLGLPSGTLWACCNVGASKPEDYGGYYAWGETQTKSNYSWDTYKYCNGSSNTLTKYCTDSSKGVVDNKTELDPSDDAATVNWGAYWQMPSYDQLNELLHSTYTSTNWTTQNGVNGLLVTSISKGNSIFLPAAGFISNTSNSWLDKRGYYYSRSLDTNLSSGAYDVRFDSNRIDSSDDDSRYFGQSVRPVRSNNK